MKIFYSLGILVATLLGSADITVAQDMMPQTHNFSTFTGKTKVVSPEMDQLTSKEGRANPDYGILPLYAPCDSCFELIDERTENTRKFIADSSMGSHFWTQTANGPINYKDGDGNWIAIDPRLAPVAGSTTVYRSTHQQTPTELDIGNKKTSFLLPLGQRFSFNHDVHLLYQSYDGVITIDLGSANYADIVGDNGEYVKNAWMGVDMELAFDKEQIKATYIIKEAFPYTEGHMIFRDHIIAPGGYKFGFVDGGEIGEKGYIGQFQAYPTDGIHDREFTWDRAIITDGFAMTEKEQFLEHGTFGEYVWNEADMTLDLYVSNEWLNKPERVFGSNGVRVDPLVTVSVASTGIYKFRINGEFCGGATYCSNIINATIGADVKITGLTFTLIYTTGSGACAFSCWRSDAAFRVWSDSCDAFYPAAPLFLSCISPTGDSPGNCIGMNINIFGLASCTLAKCSAWTLPIEFRTSYCYCNTNGTCPAGAAVPCHTVAAGNAIVNVEGHTLETLGDAVDGNGDVAYNDAFCCDDFLLDPTPMYGVSPYTYLWGGFGGGGSTESDTTVFSCADGVFVYTCTVKDACNVIRTATFTLTADNCGLLPITVTKYWGEYDGTSANLYWDTESEINNDYFTVEHSLDGIRYDVVGYVDGAENSSEPLSYEFKDYDPSMGINYYRLFQTDLNGHTDTVGTIKIEVTSPIKMNVWPNPSHSLLNVSLQEMEDDLFLEVLDVYGRRVINPFPATLKNSIDISLLENGCYFVNAVSPRNRVVKQFIKN